MTEIHPVVNVNRQLTPHNGAVNRYFFRGRLRLKHALHIGSGRGDEETDALVMRDGTGQPFIPGSSLRGVVRAQAERLLAGLYQSGVSPYWACGLYEPELPGEKFCVGNSEQQASKDAYGELRRIEERQGIAVVWQVLPDYLCDACRLFGAGTFWASKLRFIDLPVETAANTQVRHGVGIHRDTGTAAPKIKYDQEVVDSGAIFTFEVIGENLDALDLALVALALGQLQSDTLALGGSTNRGLGSVTLEEGEVTWVDLTMPTDLINYLTNGTPSGRMTLSAFVAENIARLLSSSAEGGGNA